MKVAICDDDKNQIDIIRENVSRYSIENGINIIIHEFTDGHQILDSKDTYDVLFLDIELPDMDGLSLTAKLRMQGNYNDIVIVTKYADKVRDAFYVHASDYIEKPVNYNDIKIALDRNCNRKKLHKKIVLFKDRIEYTIDITNIIYIQAYNGYVLVNLNGSIYRKDEGFLKFIDELDSRLFSVINRGIAVNLLKIEAYTNDKVIVTYQGLLLS